MLIEPVKSEPVYVERSRDTSNCLILKLEIPPLWSGMTKVPGKGFPCPTTNRGRGRRHAGKRGAARRASVLHSSG